MSPKERPATSCQRSRVPTVTLRSVLPVARTHIEISIPAEVR